MKLRNEMRLSMAALVGLFAVVIFAVVLAVMGLLNKEMDYLFMSMALCVSGYFGAKRGIAHYVKMEARVNKIKAGAGDESDLKWIE